MICCRGGLVRAGQSKLVDQMPPENRPVIGSGTRSDDGVAEPFCAAGVPRDQGGIRVASESAVIAKAVEIGVRSPLLAHKLGVC